MAGPDCCCLQSCNILQLLIENIVMLRWLAVSPESERVRGPNPPAGVFSCLLWIPWVSYLYRVFPAYRKMIVSNDCWWLIDRNGTKVQAVEYLLPLPLTDSCTYDCWTLPEDRMEHLLFKSEALRPKFGIYHWCVGHFCFHFYCIFPGNKAVWHCEKNGHKKQHWYSLSVESLRGVGNL